MKIYRIDENTKSRFKPSAACIGFFDGIHIGHQKLVLEAVKQAENNELESAAIIFDPDPSEVYESNHDKKHLMTFEQKISHLEQLGIKRVYVICFNDNIRVMSPQDFIRYLNRLNVKALICGFDFTFGIYGSGKVETLNESEEKEFSVTVIDAVLYENEKVSSRRIIDLIKKGQIEKANILLGYQYTVELRLHGKDLETTQYLPSEGEYKACINNETVQVSIHEDGLKINADSEYAEKEDEPIIISFEKRY